MNPWLLLGVGAAWVGSVGVAGLWAYGAGKDAELATQAREDKIAALASDAAASAAAAAISKIEVKHVNVRQQLEREVLTREVFRDCRSGPDAVRLFNSTLTAGGAASAPAGGQLPGADPAH